MFSIFTFGTEKIGDRKFLVCSTRWTLCNFAITLAGLVVDGLYLYYKYEDAVDEDSLFVNLFLTFGLPPMFFAIVLYAIFMKVKSFFCLCSCDFIKRSGLDVDTLEVVFLEDVRPDSQLSSLIS